MFRKFCSIVFTILQLKFKATGKTTTEVGVVHGGESTYPVVPLKFCQALLWKIMVEMQIVGITLVSE